MSLHIACIDNLSAYPFRIQEKMCPGEITYGSPAQCADWMASGKYDAALIPTAAIPGMSNHAPLPYGISCRGAVTSVVLHSRVPVQTVLHRQEAIAVPQGSVTSTSLLRQLCRITHDADIRLTSGPASTVLLIGNDSMNPARREHQWPFHYDLGEWWNDLTGLPFVFAQWVLRPGLSMEAQRQLASWLDMCASVAKTPEGLVALTKCAGTEGLQVNLPYYERLDMRLGRGHLQGLSQFLQFLEEPLCTKIA